MKRNKFHVLPGLFGSALLGFLLLSGCKRDPNTYAILDTNYGRIKIMLYDSAPKHRDNFIELAQSGFYDSLLFHRVVDKFVIQTGDPESREAEPNQVLGAGDTPYRLVPEIGAPHLYGAVGAAQKSNPQKLSSGCQFYIVLGEKVTPDQLDMTEKQKNIRYNASQRKLYQEIGGVPFLDNDYTVFGEVVKGMDIVEKISKVPTDLRQRPLEDILVTRVRIKK